MRKISVSLWVFFFTFTASLPGQAPTVLPVIPGANGFGMFTPAGRNGKVIRVKTLQDDVPGSLRAAIQEKGPKTIIFEVGGVIRLNSLLRITDPFITIAGQTAPSPGILLRGSISIETHDVLVQHLNIRPGEDGVYTDALTIGLENSRPTNVVVDHCTLAWSTDENLEVVDGDENLKVSFLDCIIAEALPPKGKFEEGFGALMYGLGSVDIQRCFFANNGQMTPLSSINRFLFINNLCYNRVQRFTQLASDSPQPSENVIIGNVFQDGPRYFDPREDRAVHIDNIGLNTGSTLYIRDNIWNQILFVDQRDLITGPTEAFWKDLPPTWFRNFNPMPSEEVVCHVFNHAGSRPAERLEIDQLFFEQFSQRKGEAIVSIQNTGGWPRIPPVYRELTIPARPYADDDYDGYTNLEEWLHALDQKVSTGNNACPALEITPDLFLIYPNPSSNRVFFNIPDNILKVQVYDFKTKLVLESPAPSNGLNIRSLRPGLYLLVVTYTDGRIRAQRLQKGEVR